jgi:hypothetical protein
MSNAKLLTITGVVSVVCLFAVGIASSPLPEHSPRADTRKDMLAEILELQTLINETSKAFQVRSEALRIHRTHCALATHAEQELNDMQTMNSARRKQVAALESMLPKVTPSPM